MKKRHQKNGHKAVEPSASVICPRHPKWNGHRPRKPPQKPNLSGIGTSM